jgi:MFS family permease
MNIGALVACIIIFKFGNLISPRVGLWIASFTSAVSVAIQIGSVHIAALYVSRILLGFSNGFFNTYSVIYIGESAPAYLRGPVIGMVTFQTSFGALIGILVDNYTQVHLGRISYQIPLAIMFAVPALMSIGLVFLPETPRYYISKGQHEKAAAAIRKLRGLNDEAQLREDVMIMKNSWAAETELNSSVRLLDAFRGTDLRRSLLSIAAAVSQTATGMIFISAFSVYFYVQAQIGSPFVWVMVGLAIALTGNMLSFPAIRYINRRGLLSTASLLNSAVMFGMAIVYTVAKTGSPAAGKTLVGLSIIFTWVYGVGQGPVLWAIQTEIPSQRLRSQTVGFAQGVSFVSAWLSSYCTPYFINPESLNWGPKYCYIWGGSNLILALFVFFFVPETRGRGLEQLDELFEKRVPAWKFSAYVTDLQQADADDLTTSDNKKHYMEEGHVEHNESI